MLILKRRVDEAIRIGEDVYVSVLGVDGNAVKIGIDAPDDYVITRLLHEEIEKQKTNKQRDYRKHATKRG